MMRQLMLQPLQTGNNTNKQRNEFNRSNTVCDGLQTTRQTDRQRARLCDTNNAPTDKHDKLTSATGCQQHTTVRVNTQILATHGVPLLYNKVTKIVGLNKMPHLPLTKVTNFCIRSITLSQKKQVCLQIPMSGVNVTQLAFTAAHHAAVAVL